MKHLQVLILLARAFNRLEATGIQAEHHKDKGPVFFGNRHGYHLRWKSFY